MSRYNRAKALPQGMIELRSCFDDERGEYDMSPERELSKIETEHELHNAMLLAYDLPIIDGVDLWEGFSVGGCHSRLIGPLENGVTLRPMVNDPLARGQEWGSSQWGDKRDRKRTKVSRRRKRNLTVEQRSKLVAYRLHLVETTGKAIKADLTDCESMVTIQENWRRILDRLQ